MVRDRSLDRRRLWVKRRSRGSSADDWPVPMQDFSRSVSPSRHEASRRASGSDRGRRRAPRCRLDPLSTVVGEPVTVRPHRAPALDAPVWLCYTGGTLRKHEVTDDVRRRPEEWDSCEPPHVLGSCESLRARTGGESGMEAVRRSQACSRLSEQSREERTLGVQVTSWEQMAAIGRQGHALLSPARPIGTHVGTCWAHTGRHA